MTTWPQSPQANRRPCWHCHHFSVPAAPFQAEDHSCFFLTFHRAERISKLLEDLGKIYWELQNSLGKRASAAPHVSKNKSLKRSIDRSHIRYTEPFPRDLVSIHCGPARMCITSAHWLVTEGRKWQLRQWGKDRKAYENSHESAALRRVHWRARNPSQRQVLYILLRALLCQP